MIKECRKCLEIKEIDMFPKHKNGRDGHLNICKECKSVYMKKYLIEYRKEEVDRYALLRRRHYLKRRNDPEFKKQSQKVNKSWRLKNKHKVSAWKKVQYALSIGKILKKPCRVCGKKSTHAHHKDYAKPLDVVWLCPKHHKLLHTGHLKLEKLH
jgi:hypothetical protein